MTNKFQKIYNPLEVIPTDESAVKHHRRLSFIESNPRRPNPALNIISSVKSAS
jgi:hypothetical protein